MGARGDALAVRFKAFHEDLVAFVESCPETVWGKVSPGEQWPVGVVARHIAAGHYSGFALVKRMVAGEALPELTSDKLDEMNAKHAAKHSRCTKEEVLNLLHGNGKSVAGYLAGLSDVELDRSAHIAAAGGEMTAEQFIMAVILQSGGEHLADMKAASGGQAPEAL